MCWSVVHHFITLRRGPHGPISRSGEPTRPHSKSRLTGPTDCWLGSPYSPKAQSLPTCQHSATGEVGQVRFLWYRCVFCSFGMWSVEVLRFLFAPAGENFPRLIDWIINSLPCVVKSCERWALAMEVLSSYPGTSKFSVLPAFRLRPRLRL